MTVSALRAFLERLVHGVRRRRARSRLGLLTSHPLGSARLVGEALRRLLDDDLAPDEVTLTKAIEARRAELLASLDALDVVDFGAGSPAEARTSEQMSQGVRLRRPLAQLTGVSKPAFWARLLFLLVRHLAPRSCVELGTCVGISAAYQAAALTLNGAGRLTTMEGSPAVADVARATLAGLHLTCARVVTGPFHETLRPVLSETRPIDLFFNDGHHCHDAVVEYFEAALPDMATSSVMVLDDIHWSTGMRQAWDEVSRHDRVAVAVNLGSMGVLLLEGHPETPLRLHLTL